MADCRVETLHYSLTCNLCCLRLVSLPWMSFPLMPTGETEHVAYMAKQKMAININNEPTLYQDQLMKLLYVYFLDRHCTFTHIIGCNWVQVYISTVATFACSCSWGFTLVWDTGWENFSTWASASPVVVRHAKCRICPRPQVPGHPIDSSLHLRTYLNPRRLPSRANMRTRTHERAHLWEQRSPSQSLRSPWPQLHRCRCKRGACHTFVKIKRGFKHSEGEGGICSLSSKWSQFLQRDTNVKSMTRGHPLLLKGCNTLRYTWMVRGKMVCSE